MVTKQHNFELEGSLSEGKNCSENLKSDRLNEKYQNPYIFIKPPKNMTLIIGMKYHEGIVLIGDRKVVDANEKSHFENKIDSPLPVMKIAVAGAGLTDLCKEFNRKIVNEFNEKIAQCNMQNLRELNGTGITMEELNSGKILLPHFYSTDKMLDDCANLVKNISESGKAFNANPLEVLMTAPSGRNTLLLFNIFCNGFKREMRFHAIGSGAQYIYKFLEDNYRDNMSLKECILLATFLIKYVQDLKIDAGIGIESGKLPQIFIVTNDKCEEYNPTNEEIDEIIKEANKRIETIKKAIIL